MNETSKVIDLAVEMALDAGRIQRERYETEIRIESKSAWTRVRELEGCITTLQDKLSMVEQQPDNSLRIEELNSELASVKELLQEKDEQLTESRKGIAEAQKMIFRLMNTVQEMRRKGKQ